MTDNAVVKVFQLMFSKWSNVFSILHTFCSAFGLANQSNYQNSSRLLAWFLSYSVINKFLIFLSEISICEVPPFVGRVN